MSYYEYEIVRKQYLTEDIVEFQLSPIHEAIPQYSAGQWCNLKTPLYLPHEEHPFSLASAPSDKLLKFIIRAYGDWTKAITKMEEGSVIHVSEAQGAFIWNQEDTYSVFLVGGVGVSGILSIIRDLADTRKHVDGTFLYGNRNQSTIMFKHEIETLCKKIGSWKIVHVLSEVPIEDRSWKGYRGFISSEIIKENVDYKRHPTWYIVGPPIFLEKMKRILSDMQIPQSMIRSEHT